MVVWHSGHTRDVRADDIAQYLDAGRARRVYPYADVSITADQIPLTRSSLANLGVRSILANTNAMVVGQGGIAGSIGAHKVAQHLIAGCPIVLKNYTEINVAADQVAGPIADAWITSPANHVLRCTQADDNTTLVAIGSAPREIGADKVAQHLVALCANILDPHAHLIGTDQVAGTIASAWTMHPTNHILKCSKGDDDAMVVGYSVNTRDVRADYIADDRIVRCARVLNLNPVRIGADQVCLAQRPCTYSAIT
ncbi:MAG: hypothetical protein WBG94_02075, partial [Anaerolineales bacterium]